MTALLSLLRIALLTICEALILAKWHWRMLLAIALAIAVWLSCGCIRIPVEVHAPFTPATATEPAKPIPLPTVPPPSTLTDADGKPIARFIPDAVAAPTPPTTFDWSTLLTAGGLIAGAFGGGWAMWASRLVALARRAVALTAAHAETVEQIQPDDAEALRVAKADAAAAQRKAGVADLINRWRDRTTERAAADHGRNLRRTRPINDHT